MCGVMLVTNFHFKFLDHTRQHIHVRTNVSIYSVSPFARGAFISRHCTQAPMKFILQENQLYLTVKNTPNLDAYIHHTKY